MFLDAWKKPRLIKQSFKTSFINLKWMNCFDDNQIKGSGVLGTWDGNIRRRFEFQLELEGDIHGPVVVRW